MLQTVQRGDKVGVAGVSGRLSSQALLATMLLVIGIFITACEPIEDSSL